VPLMRWSCWLSYAGAATVEDSLVRWVRLLIAL
jgi:hypothetical protein